MKFELFLNDASASKTLERYQEQNSDTDCIVMCNPYNARSIPIDTTPRCTIEQVAKAINDWKIRKESFGFVVYDKINSRVYLADEESVELLNKLQKINNVADIVKLIESSLQYKRLFTEILTVFI